SPARRARGGSRARRRAPARTRARPPPSRGTDRSTRRARRSRTAWRAGSRRVPQRQGERGASARRCGVFPTHAGGWARSPVLACARPQGVVVSKGLQIAFGALVVAGLLGWYAASNLDRIGTFQYYQTLAEFEKAAETGKPVRVHGYVAPASIQRDVAAKT